MEPPELNEDTTVEILLRISPDEPADLVRASAVCKLWLRTVSDPTFLRRYRAFHRGAPLLGFFHNPDSAGSSILGFVPTTAASSPPQPWHLSSVRWVSDCRHGRVLLETGSRDFAVWEPFSNHWEEVKVPSSWYKCDAVVLCTVPGCDHCGCRGGPFNVVCVGVDKSGDTIVHAHVYSSESRSWCTRASSQLDDGIEYFFERNRKRTSLIGGGVYCIVDFGKTILKYGLVENRFSLIDMPYLFESILMQNEDDSLGIAGVLPNKGSRLHICSAMVNAEGVVTGWVKQRVIDLKKILPVGVTSDKANVICFADGVEVFFISTVEGAFTYELKSGKVRKVGIPRRYAGVTPFISFFTPDLGCSKWTKQSLSRAN